MIASALTSHDHVARWPQVRLDQFKALGEMDVEFMDALNRLCDIAEKRNGWTHRINSDYRGGGRTGSMHRLGKAVDIVFYSRAPGDVDVWAQYEFAVGSRLMMRVGAYPFWNTPGLHVDTKPARLYWLCDETGAYRYALTPDAVRLMV
jgi:hypothetical protein